MAKTKAELLEKQKAANEAKQRVAMAKRKTMEEPSAVSTPSSATGVAATPETATKKLKPDAPPFTPTSTVPKPTEKNTDVKLEKKGSGEVAASFLVDVPPGKNTEEKEEGEAEEGELELPAPASEKKKQQQQHQQRTRARKKGGRGGQGRGGGRGGGNNKFNNSGKKGGRGNK